MKRNFLLFLATLISLLLVINGSKRILTLRTTSQKVQETEQRLEQLKRENEALKTELDYKSSDQFTEEEIRNKLGLAKKGEAIVVIPKETSQQSTVSSQESTPNWRKWWSLFFGS